MGLISKYIFGIEPNKAVDHVANGIKGIATMIDERKFTPEEESKANAEAVRAGIEWTKADITQSSDRSKARRDVAKKWINVYLDRLLPLYLGAELINCFYPKIQAFVVATKWAMITMGTGTLMVLGFFYGTHFARAGFRMLKGKQS